MKIGIVAAMFNRTIVQKLIKGAEEFLNEKKVQYEVMEVPGAFEIPLMASKMAASKQYDALIALGVVVKGETDHYDMVCRTCVNGIQAVMLKYEIPIAFEVLMVSDEKLAKARAKKGKTNKGYIAARVAIEMVERLKKVNLMTMVTTPHPPHKTDNPARFHQA